MAKIAFEDFWITASIFADQTDQTQDSDDEEQAGQKGITSHGEFEFEVRSPMLDDDP